MGDGSSQLFDLLSIIIAFSAVMFLLSLLVTSLAQSVQATLRLRGRNLQKGLAEILAPLFPRGSREIAASLLNSREVSVLGRRKDPTSWLGRLRGPFVSWVEPEQLRAAIEQELGAEPAKRVDDGDGTPSAAASQGKNLEYDLASQPELDVDTVIRRFEGLHKPLSKRFARTMRMVSVLLALLVAFVFQVSTPELLQRLSTDRGFREKVVAQAGELGQEGGEAPGTPAERDAAGFAQPASREDIAQLGALDFTPWRDGWEFYWRGGLRLQLKNIVGVLATVILLSLGAPFWFRVLENTVAFRDMLSPKKNGQGPSNQQQSGTGQSLSGTG